MVLGYWHDKEGYSRLIDGDEAHPTIQPPSSYAGSLEGDGYLGLINNELSGVMGYDRDIGEAVTDMNTVAYGTEAVCNFSSFKNYYNFSATYFDNFGDYDVDSSWSTYCSEIDLPTPRPFVMRYSKFLTTLDPVLVAEVLSYYPDWVYHDQVNHAVCAVGYKYINYAAELTDRWRIVHMNGGCHDDPVYLSDNLFGETVGSGNSDIGILTQLHLCKKLNTILSIVYSHFIFFMVTTSSQISIFLNLHST